MIFNAIMEFANHVVISALHSEIFEHISEYSRSPYHSLTTNSWITAIIRSRKNGFRDDFAIHVEISGIKSELAY